MKSPAVETVEDFILNFRFRTLALDFIVVGERVLERALCFRFCNGGEATLIFAGDFSFPLTEVEKLEPYSTGTGRRNDVDRKKCFLSFRRCIRELVGISNFLVLWSDGFVVIDSQRIWANSPAEDPVQRGLFHGDILRMMQVERQRPRRSCGMADAFQVGDKSKK